MYCVKYIFKYAIICTFYRKSQKSAPAPIGKGDPIQVVKIRINPGDHNLHLQNKLTTADTILTLKTKVFEETTVADPTQDDDSFVPSAEATAHNSGRPYPVCAVGRQRVMFLGKELRDSELLGTAKIDSTRVVQIFLRPQVK